MHYFVPKPFASRISHSAAAAAAPNSFSRMGCKSRKSVHFFFSLEYLSYNENAPIVFFALVRQGVSFSLAKDASALLLLHRRNDIRWHRNAPQARKERRRLLRGKRSGSRSLPLHFAKKVPLTSRSSVVLQEGQHPGRGKENLGKVAGKIKIIFWTVDSLISSFHHRREPEKYYQFIRGWTEQSAGGRK